MKYNIMEYNEKIKSLVNKPSKTQMDETLKTIFDWHDKALEQNKNITDDISVSITLQTLDGARISNLADNKEMPIEYGDEYSIDLENSGFIVFSENPTEFPLSKYVDISKIKKPIIISASELIKFCKITDMDLEFYNNRFYFSSKRCRFISKICHKKKKKVRAF